ERGLIRTGVRSAVEIVCLAFECVQAVGVENDWSLRLLHNCVDKFLSTRIARNSRTNGEDGFSGGNLFEGFERCARNRARVSFGEWFGHQLGMKTRNGRKRGTGRGNGDKACSHSER